MINAVNSNANILYTLFAKQNIQTQHTPQAEINTRKESETVKNAVPFSSSTPKPSIISHQTFSELLSIPNTAQTANSELQDIANKYNVTNLSGNERIAMAEELRGNGLISSGAMLLMVAPLSMNEDMNQKTDYLSVASNSFEFASKMGSSNEQLELQKQRLEILEQLNALSFNNWAT